MYGVSVNPGLIDQAFQGQCDINQSVQEAELIVKFNTTYTIAKEELAFTKFKPMLDSAPNFKNCIFHLPPKWYVRLYDKGLWEIVLTKEPYCSDLGRRYAIQ